MGRRTFDAVDHAPGGFSCPRNEAKIDGSPDGSDADDEIPCTMSTRANFR
jgi:hypothetical protein